MYNQTQKYKPAFRQFKLIFVWTRMKQNIVYAISW
jgi:hypothetical protein